MMLSVSSQQLILAVFMAAVVVATTSSVAPTASRVTEELETASNFGIMVAIENKLERKQLLQVHCKDKGTDFGVHQVPYGTTYRFSFFPTAFSADYFCGFVFDNVLHWFDIYLWKKDHRRCTDNTCNWLVKENGPSFNDPQTPNDCYSWNRD